MKAHIEKAENGYVVRYVGGAWTEGGKLTETGKRYRTSAETLRIYETLDAALEGIAKFYGVEAKSGTYAGGMKLRNTDGVVFSPDK